MTVPPLDGGIPRDSYTLILRLDKEFPPRFPRAGESPEVWQREAGIRQLVDMLLQEMRQEIDPDIVEPVPSDAAAPAGLDLRVAGPAPHIHS